ncbi:MAG: hypothetical protein ACOYL6_10830 [Bacteriovoracaceae bacterium]
MSNYALWIDHEHAFVYKFEAEGVEEIKLKAHNHHKKDNAPFFHEVANSLSNSEELFIMGPGTAKDEFKHHCEKHHHPLLAKSIVGLKVMESHPTKAAMLKEASTLFKNYHLWKKNY